MTLKDCTAFELQEIIKKSGAKKERLEELLAEVEANREAYKAKEILRTTELLEAKEKELEDLTAPYEGKQPVEIPIEVHKRARELSAVVSELRRKLEYLQA